MGFVFEQPLTAGVVLLRSAIQSPNFVTNIAGWSINQDGSAEFNNLIARGTITAGGGAVTLNNTGIHIVGAGNQYDISITGGFVARKLPDTGQVFQITPETLYFRPPTPSPLGNTIDYGYIDTYRVTFSAGTIESPSIRWESPRIAGTSAAAIDLRGQKSGSGFDDSAFVFQGGDFRVEASNNMPLIVGSAFTVDATGNVDIHCDNSVTIDADDDVYINADVNMILTVSSAVAINSPFVYIQHRLISSDMGMDYPAAQLFNAVIGVAVGQNNVALGNTNYPTAFPTGTTVYGFANIASGAGATAFWYPRFLPVSNTQFNLIVSRPDPATAAANITVTIAAFVVPN